MAIRLPVNSQKQEAVKFRNLSERRARSWNFNDFTIGRGLTPARWKRRWIQIWPLAIPDLSRFPAFHANYSNSPLAIVPITSRIGAQCRDIVQQSFTCSTSSLWDWRLCGRAACLELSGRGLTRIEGGSSWPQIVFWMWIRIWWYCCRLQKMCRIQKSTWAKIVNKSTGRVSNRAKKILKKLAKKSLLSLLVFPRAGHMTA